MSAYLIHTGIVIKEYLTEYKITQKELSKKTGLSESYISRVINGKAKVSKGFGKGLESVITDVRYEFWLDLDKNYQNKKRIIKETLQGVDLKKISKEYHFKDVFKGMGYTLEEEAFEMLKILGVNSFDEANEVIKKVFGYKN